MFGSVMLDVIVSMGFLYLLLSLACSAMNELIASALRLRSKDLASGVQSLLGSAAQRDKLYNHALIRSLVRNPGKKIDPSYIPSRTFALALLDQLAQKAGKPAKPRQGSDPAKPEDGPPPAQPGRAPENPRIADIKAGLEHPESKDMVESLNALIKEAGDDLKALQAGVERWFNDTMDRAGGWYKRKVQVILLALALIISVGLNVDTVMIGNALLRDSTLRATVVAAAQEYVRRSAADSGAPGAPSIDSLKVRFSGLQLPIGWNYEETVRKGTDPKAPRDRKDATWWLTKILGLMITTLAVSLGAPFWFDVLNKAAKLRASGAKPDEKEKASDAAHRDGVGRGGQP